MKGSLLSLKEKSLLNLLLSAKQEIATIFVLR